MKNWTRPIIWILFTESVSPQISAEIAGVEVNYEGEICSGILRLILGE